MAEAEETTIPTLPCSVNSMVSCLTGGDGAEDNSGLPLVASIWYGLEAGLQSFGAYAAYSVLKDGTMQNKFGRNNLYRYSWLSFVYGGLALYGPLIFLWPFSYLAIGGLTDFYRGAWDFLDPFHFIYHLVTIVMLALALNLYLYEPGLSYNVMEWEFLIYFVSIYALFRFLNVSLRSAFERFYTKEVPEVVAV